MSDDAPEARADDVEFVWVANEDPDILPTRMSKAALDPDLEDGPASKGWYEADPASARAVQFEGLSKDELVAEAIARDLDTSGTKADLIQRLAESL